MTTDAAKLAAMRRPNQISLSLLLILPSIAKAIIKITMPLPITPQAIAASTFGMNSDTTDYRVMLAVDPPDHDASRGHSIHLCQDSELTGRLGGRAGG